MRPLNFLTFLLKIQSKTDAQKAQRKHKFFLTKIDIFKKEIFKLFDISFLNTKP